jgi:hypothetical protein
MKLERVLRLSVPVLAVTFAAQFAIVYLDKPGTIYHASWKHNPKSLEEAKGLAKHIVTGVVTKVERGDDLVVHAAGEPNQQDRIPIEVATLKVEGHHKGAQDQEIKVFRTGAHKATALKRPPTGPAPPKPAKGAVDRPAQPPRLTEEMTRTVLLEDSPPYRPGERYVLFLEDGPTVKVAGAEMKTQRPISPEGRFFVSPDDKIHPVSAHPFALQLKGKGRLDIENLVKQ